MKNDEKIVCVINMINTSAMMMLIREDQRNLHVGCTQTECVECSH